MPFISSMKPSNIANLSLLPSEGVDFLMNSSIKGIKLADNGAKGELVNDAGVVTMWEPSDFDAFNTAFTEAIAQHRHWSREEKEAVPA